MEGVVMAQKDTRKQTRMTKAKKEEWLSAYMKSGYITEACRLTGVDRRTLYRLMERDEEFRLAKEMADSTINGLIDDEILRRGRDGWDEPVYQGGKQVGAKRVYDARLLLAAAKARMPERYSERHQVETKGILLNITTIGVERCPE